MVKGGESCRGCRCSGWFENNFTHKEGGKKRVYKALRGWRALQKGGGDFLGVEPIPSDLCLRSDPPPFS